LQNYVTDYVTMLLILFRIRLQSTFVFVSVNFVRCSHSVF